MPLRKHLWMIAGLSVLAIGAAIAVVQFVDGPAEPPAAIAAAAPPKAAAVAPASAPPSSQAVDTMPPVAAATPAPAAAAIIDETPPPLEAKPKESLAQMLGTTVPPAAKVAAAKPVHKPAKEKTLKTSDKAIATAPEQDTDVELLAALVAHAKFDTSANARLSLPKALEQCKKQEKQDAALCRIRVCEGRWKKDECRAYNRGKLEKAASGA